MGYDAHLSKVYVRRIEMEIGLTLRSELKDHQGGIRDIAVHESGRLFYVRTDQMMVLYDLASAAKLRGFYDSAGYDAAVFDTTGRMFLYQSAGRIHYWDLSVWQDRLVVPGEMVEFRDIDTYPKTGLRADGTDEGTIEVRRIVADSDDPPEFVLEGHQRYVECVRFHPSGRVLASGSADMTLRFWNLEARSQISSHKVHDDFVTALAFSPDGAVLISGDYSGVVRIWDFRIVG